MKIIWLKKKQTKWPKKGMIYKRVPKKKHKNLPQQFICEGQGLMNIAKIFCQSLGVISHAQMFLMVCHFRTNSCSKEYSGIRSNGLGYLFQNKNVIRSNGLSYFFTKNVICFNSLCYPFKQLGLSVWKKIVIHSNGLGYPFKKNCYPFERLWLSIRKRNYQPFEQLKLSVQR